MKQFQISHLLKHVCVYISILLFLVLDRLAKGWNSCQGQAFCFLCSAQGRFPFTSCLEDANCLNWRRVPTLDSCHKKFWNGRKLSVNCSNYKLETSSIIRKSTSSTPWILKLLSKCLSNDHITAERCNILDKWDLSGSETIGQHFSRSMVCWQCILLFLKVKQK